MNWLVIGDDEVGEEEGGNVRGMTIGLKVDELVKGIRDCSEDGVGGFEWGVVSWASS